MLHTDLVKDLRTNILINQKFQQGLDILQFSSIELEEFLEEELQKNPFLKEDESSIKNEKYIFDNRNHHKNNNSSNEYLVENIVNKITLKEHLNNQISLIFQNKQEKMIAEYITDLVDDNGYLTEDSSKIAVNLNINISIIKKIIDKLKTLDPVGVYSENLSECLEIQLKEIGLYNKDFEKILKNLHLFIKNDIKTLSAKLGLCYDRIGELMRIIKKLEPKPGRKFSSDIPIIKVPEIKISISKNDNIILEYKNNLYQNIQLDSNFFNLIKYDIKAKEDKEFIRNFYNEAKSIINSLNQRKDTILKISDALAKEQFEFFKRGILYLKPLTLSKIAEKLSLNESTISRAIKNKYIETDFGIFEIKYFFSSAINSVSSSSYYSKKSTMSSSHKVKALIKSIIDEEEKDKPLLDEEIVNSLKNFNIDIARRTVSKYRESLKIPPSMIRKKMYFLNQY